MKKHRLFITLLLTVLAVAPALAGDIIKVCGQNVENFFYLTTGQSTDPNHVFTLEQREAKMNAILQAYFRDNIPIADIYCFNEIECSDDILNYIATNFRSKTGKNFTYVQDGLGTYDNSGNIIRKSGFVYNKDVVKPYGASTATGTGQVYTRFMRMQTFEEIASGKRFTVSMNHFKAGDVGVVGSTDSNRRTENATDLLNALPNALDPDILVMGDMNSYYNDNVKEPCLQMIVDAGYEEQLYRFNPNAYAAGWGVGNFIDHVFANSTMAEQITDTKFYYVATKNSADVITPYSDHDPYMVEIELTDDNLSYNFIKATEVKAGGKYLLVANGTGNGRKLFGAISGSFGNASAIDAEETDGIITFDTDNQLMTFEDAGNSQYYIKYSNGKYITNGAKNGGGYYTTFTPTTSNPQAYTVNKRTDGRFLLKNAVSNQYIYYGNSGYSYANNVWSSYSNLNNSNQQAPFLYELKSNTDAISTVTVYSQPTVTRKVMENGRLIIVTADGTKYSVQGVQVKQ